MAQKRLPGPVLRDKGITNPLTRRVMPGQESTVEGIKPCEIIFAAFTACTACEFLICRRVDTLSHPQTSALIREEMKPIKLNKLYWLFLC